MNFHAPFAQPFHIIPSRTDLRSIPSLGPAASSVVFNTREGGNSSGGLSGGGLTLTFPDVVPQGGDMLMTLGMFDNTLTLDTPAGWTKIAETQHSTIGMTLTTFHKLGDAVLDPENELLVDITGLNNAQMVGDVWIYTGSSYDSVVAQQGLDEVDESMLVPGVAYTDSGMLVTFRFSASHSIF